MAEVEDKLNYQNNPTIKDKIGDEKIYFSDRIQKKTVNMFSKAQERNIVITNLGLYNFKGTEYRRRIKIEDIKAITISKTSNQFVIHGNQNEYDYLYIYPNRQKLIKCLQYVYKNKTGKDLLFCKKSCKELSKFVVTKKERTKNPNMFKLDLVSINDYLEGNDIIQTNLNIEDYSNEELIKKLKEEKNKNSLLLKEIDNEKKELQKKINELEKEIDLKNKEINNLKKKLENNDLVTTIKPGEKVIAVNFTSIDQTINYPLACKNTTLLSRLEEKVYNNYPNYKEHNTYLTVNGRITKRFKTLEENKIENGNAIMVNIYDE